MQSFINLKSKQLVFYMQAYWHEDLPYQEIENFMWDTLEEWTQVDYKHGELYSHKERVFWHLFHQTQYVSSKALKHDDLLKAEITFCMEYLQNNLACPLDVVGMRP